MSDPISDMLTRIRNASLTNKEKIRVPYSRLKFEIARLLEKEGWIERVKVIKAKKISETEMEIKLKYSAEGKPAISEIRRISRPGRRIYQNHLKMPKILNGFGMAIISTSLGLMSDKEAKKRKVGGEVICEIW
ncbi:MAG: 30S ribosomal protein S8 [Parcubacteria group bacterium ADurb.Bin159]|nr:MAG: 30S ribosomal protein S8 [Parcubacteria group bacterium ADurb.Bin159]